MQGLHEVAPETTSESVAVLRAPRRSKVRAKLAVVKSAAKLLQTTQILKPPEVAFRTPPLKAASRRELIRRDESFAKSKRRVQTPRIPCDKEIALKKAYDAAADLLGAAKGDLTLTPLKKLKESAATNDDDDKELPLSTQALMIEQALISKIKALSLQLEATKQRAKSRERDQMRRVAEIDRVLFNAHCGLDLMKDLAKQAKIDACHQAIDFMKKRQTAKMPPLLRIIDDQLLVKHHELSLTVADDILEKHGRKSHLYTRELPEQRKNALLPGDIF